MDMTHIHNIYIWHISHKKHNVYYKLPREIKHIKSPRHYGFPWDIDCIKSNTLKPNKKKHLTFFGGFRWTQKKYWFTRIILSMLGYTQLTYTSRHIRHNNYLFPIYILKFKIISP
jgi:hypothetical protein